MRPLAPRLALLACLALPAAAPAAPASADLTPNVIALVKGMRGDREVGRWGGALRWDGAAPIIYTARQHKGRLQWQPHTPDHLRIQASDDRPQGKAIGAWAREVGATRLVVVIVPRPGQGGENTERAHQAVRRTTDVPPSPTVAEADADAPEASTPPADPAPPWAPVSATQPPGRGERGDGPGRGLAGEQANDNLSGDAGTQGGSTSGSTRPSLVDNPRAQLTQGRGGHTPGDGGRRDGSAGGEEGATGHIHGSGWFSLIDAPEDIAPLVSAGLILTDANVLGFGHKMLSRVVTGLGTRALRRELARDGARIVAHDLALVRDKLARMPAYRGLSTQAQEALLKRTEAAMTRAYYARARKLFAEQARTFEQVAARHASDQGDAHIHTLASENAAAYRKMAAAADDEYARLAPVAASPNAPQLPARKSTRAVRRTEGVATGGQSLKKASGNWLRGTHRNAAPLPAQVADVLRGKRFASWDAMRAAVWKAVAADKALHGPFDAYNLKRMQAGYAPRVAKAQVLGVLDTYVLHHRMPIQHGGSVYELDNIVVVTPRYHKEVLDASYHQGRKK